MGKKGPPSAKARAKEEAHYREMLKTLEPGWTIHRSLDEHGNVIGYVRNPPADDPRSINHPSHREQLNELARALGRAMAAQEWERLHGDKTDKPKP